MSTLWNWVSNLGLSDKSNLFGKREIILSNQLNFIMLITMCLLLITTIAALLLTNDTIYIGTLRIIVLAIVNFLNLVAARFRHTKISTLSLVFVPPIVFLIWPTLMGYVEEESYTYYPYALIAASIIPQLLLMPDKQKYLYWFSLLYYLFLVIFIDRLMIRFESNSFLIIDRIREFYPFYKIAHVGIFLFSSASIYYLRKQNIRFEDSLNKQNQILDLKNKELTIQRGKILKQKNIIEQKSKDITGSIQYASRIQAAVLPPINFLSEWSIDNFILYKPKDVVSGDFYWGIRKQNRIVVAAVDCTGHGVPGAFMSMLGNAFLYEILNNNEVGNAASVLNLLRNEVINTLKQKGASGEARDGMDISLCIIEKETGKLDFAGANNPLYLIRDNNLTIVQPDKMPIGIYHTSAEPFTNKTIDIKKGDYLYLFSDGYADQFGGSKRRKFMYGPFQQLILRNHNKSMDLQKEILNNTFEKWKGENEQIDDVLVIGLHL
jgi:serine phosphatase RsbU (regulator of sigma subunit)